MKTSAWKRYIVALVLGMVVIVTLPSVNYANSFNVDRINGENRYETAVAVSKKGWTSSNTVIIAAGNQFPDALTGTPLAYSLNAPILLTQNSSLPSETKNEITRLKAKHVIILGGTSVVTANVETQLKKIGITNIERISGTDRYSTSVKIAEKLAGQTDTAVLVYGKNFPDSLAIAAHAARKGYPILLTKTDSLPPATKKVLSKYKNTIVVGGTGVISDKIMKDVPNAKRYSGKDRYDTVTEVVNGLNVKFGENVYVATGQSYADALTGSVLAAKKNSSLVLVQKDKVPSSVQTVLNSVSSSQASIIGGTSAVSSNVEIVLGFNTDALVKTAKQYLGTPYQYGGTTPSGFDCSGYIKFVFEKHGISTPRTTRDLYAGGKSVSKLEVGDIVFFKTDPSYNGASHAGIYIGDNKFIHAKSAGSNIGVTIDEMSNSYFYPRYLGAKRYH